MEGGRGKKKKICLCKLTCDFGVRLTRNLVCTCDLAGVEATSPSSSASAPLQPAIAGAGGGAGGASRRASGCASR